MGHAANGLKDGELRALVRVCLDVRLFLRHRMYAFEPGPAPPHAAGRSPGHARPAISPD